MDFCWLTKTKPVLHVIVTNILDTLQIKVIIITTHVKVEVIAFCRRSINLNEVSSRVEHSSIYRSEECIDTCTCIIYKYSRYINYIYKCTHTMYITVYLCIILYGCMHTYMYIYT